MINRRELLKLISTGSAALSLAKFIQAERAELATAAHDLVRAECQSGGHVGGINLLLKRRRTRRP